MLQTIQFNIDSELIPQPDTKRKNHKKCNYTKYKHNINKRLTEKPCKKPQQNNKGKTTYLKNKTDIDYVTDHLTEIMKSAYNESCPNITLKTRRTKNIWTSEIKTKHSRLIKTKKRISYLKIIKWKKN